MAHKGKSPKGYNPPNRPLFFAMSETKNNEFWDNLEKAKEEEEKEDERNIDQN